MRKPLTSARFADGRILYEMFHECIFFACSESAVDTKKATFIKAAFFLMRWKVPFFVGKFTM